MTQRTLLHAFATFDLGGPQARFVALANAYGERYRHLIVAMDGRYGAATKLEEQVPWTRVELPIRKGSGLANRGRFAQALVHHRPDLLATYNWGAIEWVAANLPRRVAAVHVEEGFDRDEVQRQHPRRRWFRRVLLGATRTPLVVASERLRDVAIRQWGVSERRVRFLSNGVDVERFGRAERSAMRVRFGVPTQATVVGTVARFRPEKNVMRLLEAFARVSGSQDRLLLIGDGPDQPALLARAAALGVAERVHFGGSVNDPENALAALDIFALSSDTEQMPMAMLEAMASALPVVSTRVGDVARILPEGNWLADPDDVAFASALAQALDARERWADAGRANRGRVQARYDWESTLAAWQQVYDGHFDGLT